MSTLRGGICTWYGCGGGGGGGVQWAEALERVVRGLLDVGCGRSSPYGVVDGGCVAMVRCTSLVVLVVVVAVGSSVLRRLKE